MILRQWRCLFEGQQSLALFAYVRDGRLARAVKASGWMNSFSGGEPENNLPKMGAMKNKGRVVVEKRFHGTAP